MSRRFARPGSIASAVRITPAGTVRCPAPSLVHLTTLNQSTKSYSNRWAIARRSRTFVIPPNHAYIVCSTQRSGSTYLCDLLASTGVTGRPLEYFEARTETGSPPHPGYFLAGLPRTGAGIRDDQRSTDPRTTPTSARSTGGRLIWNAPSSW